MPFLLQFPHGSRPLRLLLTPALGSILLTSLAAAHPLTSPATPHVWAAIPARTDAVKDLYSAFLVNAPVSGRVVDADGQGMPGVTVVVAGTTLGGATNTNGEYLIPDVPAGAQTLVISSVGYITARIPITVVDGQTTTVGSTTLNEDVQALKEVVVVGYGTQSRQELTTAVSSVSAKALERQPVAGFDQALQGQTPGVQVTSPSGAPGAGINVRIRGNNSISMSNSPLYVIDGVPVLPTYDRELSIGNQKPNPLNTLNPNDIESIDVLKDGAAAAIYGLRASNGVVVITTKRGKIGKPQLGFSMFFGQQQLRKKIDLLNARQFAEYYNEARANASTPLGPAYTDLNNLPANTDWQDEMYRKAAIQSYQLNVSGGTDKTRYYVSGGYFKQDGIIRNSGFDRYNFKLNLDQQAGNRFRFGTNLNFSRTNNNGSVRSEIALGSSGTVLGALAQIPTVPVYNPDGTYGLNPFSLSDNPIGNLLETHNNAIIYQAIGNVYGEADIRDNLKFRTSLGLDFRTQLENQYITREYPGTSRSTPEQNLKGSAATGTNIQNIWLWENTLTYDPKLGDRHRLTLLAGQSVQESNRFTSGASSQGFASNASPYVSAGATRTGTNSYEDEWGLMSYFGRAIYNYDERYLATVSLRADATSKFEQHWGYFPAVSVAWRVAKESFFPQNGTVSDFKIRGSYGVNGNQEIYTYSRFSSYDTGSNYGGGSGTNIVGGIRPGRIGNRDLKWETTKQVNVGVDLNLLQDRAQFTFDAYRKRTTDLLYNVPIAPSTGAQTLEVTQNLGEIENKGIELGLTTNNVQGNEGSFSWTTNLNFTLNRNQLVNLGQQTNEQNVLVDREVIGNNNILRKGQPLGSFFGYVATGIFQSADEIKSAPKQDNAKPGDVRFADVNNDGVINDKDRTIIGNPNPKSIAGVTNTFTFKGLELSVFFQGSFGNDIQNLNRQTIESAVGPVNQSTAVLNRWTPTNTNTNIPRASTEDLNQNNRFSTRFVEDGSYVRLKNLTLAYNIPTTLLQKAHFSGLRLYVTGQNLLTWTDYSGYDPEVSADPFSSTTFGRDFGTYPQARTYTIGLNASF
ncbi:SusC/RagA family TonB-linked outer membrane protein [Hymenobacter chitinivorans]|uniref:TonB-linked SusC/RagA family outer membrane protein n=1 Tax=Hymenobacter chitinivorans DSM 11115 TaxID=1121954 RepID=A0A2M9BL27_9BACT|nr:TonB-dependent receptor [Hymenobacter chitinivorans]PJJ58659.1 TonB-linked SusC/RagA family outer membrane protein [Hymenobacter chitinivorans DSM 11115]